MLFKPIFGPYFLIHPWAKLYVHRGRAVSGLCTPWVLGQGQGPIRSQALWAIYTVTQPLLVRVDSKAKPREEGSRDSCRGVGPYRATGSGSEKPPGAGDMSKIWPKGVPTTPPVAEAGERAEKPGKAGAV